ncbi:MAG: hypothetical protein Q7R47_02830, partial [Candidatus Diapherotrites archaeon]|nr:hypothetical protein [Candidatus Diapherotrites archaeon]
RGELNALIRNYADEHPKIGSRVLIKLDELVRLGYAARIPLRALAQKTPELQRLWAELQGISQWTDAINQGSAMPLAG